MGQDVTIVETRVSVWEALAGRAPGQPLGPADPGLWAAVAERVNPTKARPQLRAGLEEAHLTSVRGVPYVMLRSPDKQGCYLRLTPDEVELTRLMDGSRTLARLVADFARITGRLAPDQVRRVVADLAGNRMLEELPLDAFRPLSRVRRRPWPIRLGRGILAFVQGRRMVLANVDPLVGFLYKAGGRLLFTRVVVALMAAVAAVGLAAFCWQWWAGEQSVFLTSDSYFTGALVLLGLNVVALACHELGHALAAKHAGRRVPAAGFLVYFGIPSVFVDTTDVWMAGRRARLRTTAAGPSAGLVLAGASALVGLVDPALAPWCFKLSFAWYVNAMFNLNPFLALDGYYLLMDWLEVPNLRARGLSWVVARVVRKPPRWSTLDREGRLIALYGLLAVGWLVIAANIGYRIYSDRVSGLIIGLWRTGWAARGLLIVVVAALASPLVYLFCGWLARRWRRLRDRLAERKTATDIPRRLDALRTSQLGELPIERLTLLAASSSWVRPRTGEQLVFAGAAQPRLFAVVEGALEGRRPGDPAGTVRERIGVGGVVGLGCAITGAPSTLSWYAAGTRLLSVPASAVASAVGGSAAGGLTGAAAEAEQLIAEAPALQALSYEDRLGLAAAARTSLLSPGEPVVLPGPDEAVLVAAGVIATPDGAQLGRGTLIGPAGEELPGAVAHARTPVRLLILPAVSGLPLLLGASAGVVAARDLSGHKPGTAPVFGVHPPAAYPPLAIPPGPPPPLDDETDRRFERKLRWLLILVLLFGLFLTGANTLVGPAWAEMPGDSALLRIDRGTASATVDGERLRMAKGDDVYVSERDQIRIDRKSRATLIYRGGAYSVLCPQVDLTVGKLVSTGHPVTPAAALQINDGIVITSTRPAAASSAAFRSLDATLTSGARQSPNFGTITNEGDAWYSVAPWGMLVSSGIVKRDGTLIEPTGLELGCGDDEPVPQPSPSNTTSATPGTTLTDTPAATPTPTPTVGPTLTPPTTVPTTTKTTTKPPTHPTTTTTRPTTTPPTTPPANKPPTITQWWTLVNIQAQRPPAGATCTGGRATQIAQGVYAQASDPDDPMLSLRGFFDWRLDTDGTKGSGTMSWGDGILAGGFIVDYAKTHAGGGTITINIYVRDPAGNQVGPKTLRVTLDVCQPVEVPR